MTGRACIAVIVVACLVAPFWISLSRETASARRTKHQSAGGDQPDCVGTRDTSPSPAADFFPDVTDLIHVDFAQSVGPLGTYFMPEINGTGGALFDCDGDGDLDILFVNSARSPNAQGDFGPGTRLGNALYRQESDGTFSDVTTGSGIEGGGYGVGCAVGDIDNDGDLDVYVTHFGPDRLYRNNGDCTFTDISAAAGIDDHDYGTCAAFFDYDRDGWLDLIVVNYVHDPVSGLSVGCGSGSGRVSYCGPHKFVKSGHRLYHNETAADADQSAGPRFRDVTEAMGLSDSASAAFGVLCADFDRDGWPDAFVANDMAPNRLWMNREGRLFQDQAQERGTAVNGKGLAQGSMGVALGDYDGDGDFDIVVTNLFNESTTLYVNDGAGMFIDGTRGAELRSPTLRHTGWGVALVDLDHDGVLDIPQVNGLVVPCRGNFPPHGEDTFQFVSAKIADPQLFWGEYADGNLLLIGSHSGRFIDLTNPSRGFTRKSGNSGRALICGDIDNDGDADLVVTNCGGRARIYRNDFPKSGHWLLIRAFDPRLNRDAYGAEVMVVTGQRQFRRLIQPASSYLASNDPRAHFGLGPAPGYDAILVAWPDGLTEEFEPGAADRIVTLNRGEGRPIIREK